MARRGQKKFATWEYRDAKQGIVVKVPVIVVDQSKSSYHNSGTETYFVARVNELDIDEHDTDVNRLRTTVFAQIKSRITVEWKTVIVVEVFSKRIQLHDEEEPRRMRKDARAFLRINWGRQQLATIDGVENSREFSGSSYNFDTDTYVDHWGGASRDWPKTGPSSDYGDEGFTAVIADTPENRAALESIADALEASSQKLMALLGNDNIEQVLAQIASGQRSIGSLSALPGDTNGG